MAEQPDKAEWTDIDGATGATYAVTAPVHGMWYRCVVGATESKPVQAVRPNSDSRTWTNDGYKRNGSYWYISNGTMAYIRDGDKFDVTGQYTKGGTTYMLQTVYNCAGWNMYYATSGEPGDGGKTAASGNNVMFSFSDTDAYAIYITVELPEGQQAFSFGSDTMLGDSSTSGSYADAAALETILAADGTLQQVSMIGARSSEDADDSDPAFVITPVTKKGLRFYLNEYSGRKYFIYNTNSSESGETMGTVRAYNADGTLDRGTRVVTKLNGVDSEMTMSWLNVTDGSISFMFSVGDVASTGAVQGKVNYASEELEGLDPDTLYEIECDDETYVIKADANGKIPLSGTDVNDKDYNFIGKRSQLRKRTAVTSLRRSTSRVVLPRRMPVPMAEATQIRLPKDRQRSEATR